MKTAQWLKLTDDDGQPLYIELSHLLAIAAPQNPTYGARVYFGMFQVDVVEDAEFIKRRAHELRPLPIAGH